MEQKNMHNNSRQPRAALLADIPANKPVWQLLCDLLSFEDQDLLVKMSLDGGNTVESLRIQLNELVIEHEISIRKLVDFLRLHVHRPDSKIRLCRAGEQLQRPIARLVRKKGCCIVHGEA